MKPFFSWKSILLSLPVAVLVAFLLFALFFLPALGSLRGGDVDAKTKVQIGFALTEAAPVATKTSASVKPERKGCTCREGGPCSCGDHCQCEANEYKLLRSHALKDNRAFCVWVGLEPCAELYSGKCIHFRCQSFQGDDRPRVIVAHPANGELAISNTFEGGDFCLQALEESIKTPACGARKAIYPQVQSFPSCNGQAVGFGSPVMLPLRGTPMMGFGAQPMGLMGGFGGGSSGGC